MESLITDDRVEPFDENLLEQKEQGRGIKIICCLCGVSFNPSITKTNICMNCISNSENIDQDIQKEAVINFCKNCQKYLGNQWIYCEKESKELLAICLKKLKNLTKVKIIESSFLFTEPHSKKLKIKLKIQKEIMNSTQMQQDLVVEIIEHYIQCNDCKKQYTPHTWNSKIQVRQYANHKKTFFFIEQLIIKHKAQNKLQRVQEVEHGLDFFYRIKQDAIKFVDFIWDINFQNKLYTYLKQCHIQGFVPTKIKFSQKFISANEQNHTSNTQYTWLIEIPKVSKDDLVIFPLKLCKELGGYNQIMLCTGVSSSLHFVDPLNQKRVDLQSEKYFQHEESMKLFSLREYGALFIQIYQVIQFFQQIFLNTPYNVEFLVSDSDKIHNENLNESFLSSVTNAYIDRIMEVTVSRTSDWVQFLVKTHLGNLCRVGNTLIGYDLSVINDENIDKVKNKPDIVLVKKIQPEKNQKNRIWKLKKLNIEQMQVEKKHAKKQLKEDAMKQLDEKEFLDDIENNKEYRQNISLFKNKENIEKVKDQKMEKSAVQIGELLDDISDKEHENFSDEEIYKNLKIDED